jgi:hypothetical protein
LHCSGVRAAGQGRGRTSHARRGAARARVPRSWGWRAGSSERQSGAFGQGGVSQTTPAAGRQAYSPTRACSVQAGGSGSRSSVAVAAALPQRAAGPPCRCGAVRTAEGEVRTRARPLRLSAAVAARPPLPLHAGYRQAPTHAALSPRSPSTQRK